MSSVVTWSVSSYPSTTIATESPTRITSAPAASTVRADGASYAVTMTRGGPPSPLRAATAGAVTRRAARAVISTILHRPGHVRLPAALARVPVELGSNHTA